MSVATLGDRVGRLWPGTALLSWTVSIGVTQYGGWAAGCLVAFAAAMLHRRPWRRWVVAIGLPAALALQAAAVPAWGWLVLVLGLLLLYPQRHWGDAPLYLTPAHALAGLPPLLPLPDGAQVLDAGCGSGAALRAWHRAYPRAALHGTEASRPLAAWARWRCPWAQVRHGDFWDDDWSQFEVIYLFQRPETMPAALEKALAEPNPAGWLVSLDFPLPGPTPRWALPLDRHMLYVYARDGLN